MTAGVKTLRRQEPGAGVRGGQKKPTKSVLTLSTYSHTVPLYSLNASGQPDTLRQTSRQSGFIVNFSSLQCSALLAGLAAVGTAVRRKSIEETIEETQIIGESAGGLTHG